LSSNVAEVLLLVFFELLLGYVTVRLSEWALGKIQNRLIFQKRRIVRVGYVDAGPLGEFVGSRLQRIWRITVSGCVLLLILAINLGITGFSREAFAREDPILSFERNSDYVLRLGDYVFSNETGTYLTMRRVLHWNTRSCYSNNLTHLIVYKTAFRAENLDPNLAILNERSAVLDAEAMVQQEALCLNGVGNELVEDQVSESREFNQAVGLVRARPASLITVDNSSGLETAVYAMNVEILDSGAIGNLLCSVSDSPNGSKQYICLYDVSSGDGRQIFQSYNRGGIDSVEFDLSEAVDDAVTEKTDWLDAEKASVLKLVILGYNLNHALTAAFEQLEQSMVLAGKVNEFATRIDIYALGLGSCWITIVAVTTITRLVVYLCHRDTDVGIGARFDSRSLYGHFRDRELQLGDCTLKGRLREEKVGILCERPHFGVMDGNVVGKWEVNELRGQNCGRRVGGQPELCSS